MWYFPRIAAARVASTLSQVVDIGDEFIGWEHFHSEQNPKAVVEAIFQNVAVVAADAALVTVDVVGTGPVAFFASAIVATCGTWNAEPFLKHRTAIAAILQSQSS